jgi:uncharacterized DUF497 family protein
MLSIVITPEIREKLLKRHNVKEGEVEECFFNNEGVYLEDTEEEHITDPPTEWFVSPTDRGRLLKIIFVFRDGNIFLKSAYDANQKTISIYNELCKKQEQ